MRSLVTAAVLAAAGLATAGLVTAGSAAADGGGPPAPRIAAPPTQGALQLTIDTAAPVRLSDDAAGVIIGNPSIAGVSVQSSRLLFVTGRSYGTTSLTVVDSAGATIYHRRITVIPDETGAVMVTRGTETNRLSCNPICRPSPDIGDSEESFSGATGQIGARNSAAQGGE